MEFRQGAIRSHGAKINLSGLSDLCNVANLGFGDGGKFPGNWRVEREREIKGLPCIYKIDHSSYLSWRFNDLGNFFDAVNYLSYLSFLNFVIYFRILLHLKLLLCL